LLHYSVSYSHLLSLFFSLSLPLPRSTLFPYTTLFRSRTMSSGVTGSGFGWNHLFVNRYVDKNYNVDDHKQEMEAYLKSHGFHPDDTVGMMTAVNLSQVAYQFIHEEGFSGLFVVTAGVGNAVDSTLGVSRVPGYIPGTINIWVFINGELSEEAYIQAV